MKDLIAEKNKRTEIIASFTNLPFEKQLEKYRYDPVFHSIIEMLARDLSPFSIIEFLLEDRERLVKELNAALYKK